MICIFFACLFSFYAKKCRTQFRIYALPNVTHNGQFFPSANLDVLGKQNRRDEQRLFMRVRIYFQLNRNSGVELFRRREPLQREFRSLRKYFV